MPPPSLLFLLLLPFVFHLSADSIPTDHGTPFSTHRIHQVTPSGPPVEHFAVGRPLPTETLTPAYTMRIVSQGFGQTVGLPPATETYYAPACSWSRAVVEIAGYGNGTQFDGIVAVWLSGVELIRGSTPQSGPEGVYWKVQKDITRYDYVLRQTNITLSVMLENTVDDVHVGGYWLNITFLYYNNTANFVPPNATEELSLPQNQETESKNLKDNADNYPSLELDEYQADLIIPICSSGENGFWFKINSGIDAVLQGIKIPQNTYRAVVEIYISPHGYDETWFANPPDSYIQMNGLPTRRGHGAYREVMVRIDDTVIGATIPFTVFYGGGVNPLFWQPLAAIRAFDFPTYEFELTPFLGMLLDGRKHNFGLSVADAISYWLASANLHIWLDKTGERVLAGPIKYSDPATCIQRESKFQQLEGKIDIGGERDSEWSGWVNSSLGNYTTLVTRKINYESTLKFLSNGAEKEVKQEVVIDSQVRVSTTSGTSVTRLNVKNKFPLKLRITDHGRSGEGSRLLSTKLEYSLEVTKQDRNNESKLQDSQTCKGWKYVSGPDVLSGSASTEQRYEMEDRLGCYSRRVEADGGLIKNDAALLLCGELESF